MYYYVRYVKDSRMNIGDIKQKKNKQGIVLNDNKKIFDRIRVIKTLFDIIMKKYKTKEE